MIAHDLLRRHIDSGGIGLWIPAEVAEGEAFLSGAVERVLQARQCTARFDVMHFEQVVDDGDPEEMPDPSALLSVLEILTTLTEGIGIDPQSGELV